MRKHRLNFKKGEIEKFMMSKSLFNVNEMNRDEFLIYYVMTFFEGNEASIEHIILEMKRYGISKSKKTIENILNELIEKNIVIKIEYSRENRYRLKL